MKNCFVHNEQHFTVKIKRLMSGNVLKKGSEVSLASSRSESLGERTNFPWIMKITEEAKLSRCFRIFSLRHHIISHHPHTLLYLRKSRLFHLNDPYLVYSPHKAALSTATCKDSHTITNFSILPRRMKKVKTNVI